MSDVTRQFRELLALERNLGTISIPDAHRTLSVIPLKEDTKAVLLWCSLIITMCEDVGRFGPIFMCSQSFIQQLITFICGPQQLVAFVSAKTLTEVVKVVWHLSSTVELNLIEEALKAELPHNRTMLRFLADLFREVPPMLRSELPRVDAAQLISVLNSPDSQDQYAALDLIECEGERLTEFLLPVASSLWDRKTFPFVRYKAILFGLEVVVAATMQGDVVQQLFFKLATQMDIFQSPSEADLRRSWFVLFIHLWRWLESNNSDFFQATQATTVLVATTSYFLSPSARDNVFELLWDTDDLLILAMRELLLLSGCPSAHSVLFITLYHPVTIFWGFLSRARFDYTLMLDFLIGNETSFLDYLLHFLKFLVHERPGTSIVEDTKVTEAGLTRRQYQRMGQVLARLNLSLHRLNRKNLLSYDVTPLTRLLSSVSDMYIGQVMIDPLEGEDEGEGDEGTGTI